MHRIHLKGPWEFQPLVGDGSETGRTVPPGGTVKFPAAWGDFLGEFRGQVRFTRPFNRPTNLELHERVDLVLDGVGGSAEVRLNEQPVGRVAEGETSARFEITSLLRPHNILSICVNWASNSPAPGGLWAPVALEIVSNSSS